MTRKSDPLESRARELCLEAGIDPDSRISKGYRTNGSPLSIPAWCDFRDAVRKEQKLRDSYLQGDCTPIEFRSRSHSFEMLIEAENSIEEDNICKVEKSFIQLMKTPVVKAGAVMPDACPAGPEGTIPVGGVVSSTEIHPGFHSSDICCSVALSIFSNCDPKHVLDAGMKISHFGAGGRSYSHDMKVPDSLLAEFEGNVYLSTSTEAVQKHFATQGDGNHFFYVGFMKSTGQVALITHHGSRKPGALLYDKGIDIAKKYTSRICPEVMPDNAWIPSDSQEGQDYWKALQIIRAWTKKNHFAIHDGVAKMLGVKVNDRFWNEHNFVFQKSDGLFYHGKGATPAWKYFAADATDLTIIPLNMKEPILIVRGKDNPEALGFSPHGAGRNLSRTGHMKLLGNHNPEQVFIDETVGIDARFYNGYPDLSELPSAYKNAASVRRQITKFGLAELVDEVIPYGTIMAGENHWIRKRRKIEKGIG